LSSAAVEKVLHHARNGVEFVHHKLSTYDNGCAERVAEWVFKCQRGYVCGVGGSCGINQTAIQNDREHVSKTVGGNGAGSVTRCGGELNNLNLYRSDRKRTRLRYGVSSSKCHIFLLWYFPSLERGADAWPRSRLYSLGLST